MKLELSCAGSTLPEGAVGNEAMTVSGFWRACELHEMANRF